MKTITSFLHPTDTIEEGGSEIGKREEENQFNDTKDELFQVHTNIVNNWSISCSLYLLG